MNLPEAAGAQPRKERRRGSAKEGTPKLTPSALVYSLRTVPRDLRIQARTRGAPSCFRTDYCGSLRRIPSRPSPPHFDQDPVLCTASFSLRQSPASQLRALALALAAKGKAGWETNVNGSTTTDSDRPFVPNRPHSIERAIPPRFRSTFNRQRHSPCTPVLLPGPVSVNPEASR